MYYVYVLQSKADDSLYTGYTNDLKIRIESHNSGENFATKFKKPFALRYYEAYDSKSDAKYRESQLKRHSGAMTHLKKRIKNSIAGA